MVEDQLRSVVDGWYDISEIENSLETKKQKCDTAFTDIRSAEASIVDLTNEIGEIDVSLSIIDYEALQLNYRRKRLEERKKKSTLIKRLN